MILVFSFIRFKTFIHQNSIDNRNHEEVMRYLRIHNSLPTPEKIAHRKYLVQD